jgi:hypothetical protein
MNKSFLKVSLGVFMMAEVVSFVQPVRAEEYTIARALFEGSLAIGCGLATVGACYGIYTNPKFKDYKEKAPYIAAIAIGIIGGYAGWHFCAQWCAAQVCKIAAGYPHMLSAVQSGRPAFHTDLTSPAAQDFSGRLLPLPSLSSTVSPTSLPTPQPIPAAVSITPPTVSFNPQVGPITAPAPQAVTPLLSSDSVPVTTPQQSSGWGLVRWLCGG